MIRFNEIFFDIIFYDFNGKNVWSQSDVKFVLDLKQLLSGKKMKVFFHYLNDISIRYHLRGEYMSIYYSKESLGDHLKQYKDIDDLFDRFLEIVKYDSL